MLAIWCLVQLMLHALAVAAAFSFAPGDPHSRERDAQKGNLTVDATNPALPCTYIYIYICSIATLPKVLVDLVVQDFYHQHKFDCCFGRACL